MSEQLKLPTFNFGAVELNDEQLGQMIEADKPKFEDNSKFFRPGKHEVKIISSKYKGLASDPAWAKWVIEYEGTNEKTITDMVMVPTTSKLTYKQANGKEGTFAVSKLKTFLEALGTEFSVKTLGTILPSYFGAEDAVVGLNVAITTGYPGLHLKYQGKTAEGKVRIAIVNRRGEALEGLPEFESYEAAEKHAETAGLDLKKFVEVLDYAKSSVENKAAGGNDKNW